jgi:hypothetical protein
VKVLKLKGILFAIKYSPALGPTQTFSPGVNNQNIILVLMLREDVTKEAKSYLKYLLQPNIVQGESSFCSSS